MNILLSKTERNFLLSEHKKERDSRVSDRIKAVLLFNKGKHINEIAEFLFIYTNTANRYINEYKADKKLKPSSSPPSANKLTESETC